MTEPTYQYIKGLGWQPFPSFESIEVTLKNGNRWRLEARTPEIGDRCIWAWSGSRTWVVKGKANLHEFKQWFEKSDIAFGETRIVDTALLERLEKRENDPGMGNETVCWVTMVHLD